MTRNCRLRWPVFAEHVYDIGMESANDRSIWNYALQNKAVIITKDEDFISLVSTSLDVPPVIWIRVGNIGKQALLKWFAPMMANIIIEIEAGEKLIEIA